MKSIAQWLPALFFLCWASPVKAEIQFEHGLELPSAGSPRRTAFRRDPLEAKLAAGNWKTPKAGHSERFPDGTVRRWKESPANRNGVWETPKVPGGYLFFKLVSPKEEIAELKATGHDSVFVNGEPRVGDPYGSGIVSLPILIRKGENRFLFRRGPTAFSAKLHFSPKSLAFLPMDTTLPDLISGARTESWGAVMISNATQSHMRELTISFRTCNGPTATRPVPTLLPLSVRKIAFPIFCEITPRETCSVTLELRKGKKGEIRLDEISFPLRVRSDSESQVRTFLSTIDGSVQSFAALPPFRASETIRPALFLALHGAGVSPSAFLDSYGQKAWGIVVAPMNRRPFGFDWEDWGRIDALEVLQQAATLWNSDPNRVYVTGHSMGGHGSWHLGVTYPDRFAAIGPSAGWISMSTYPSPSEPTPNHPIDAILARANAPSDTLALIKNTKGQGVYLIHGDSDENVPVAESRRMKRELASFHSDVIYHEQPKGRHVWNLSERKGYDSIDWPDLFDFFAHHSLPSASAIRKINFTTMNPGISSQNYWSEIINQEHASAPSHVELQADPETGSISGKTENVRTLRLTVTPLNGRLKEVNLDGTKLNQTFQNKVNPVFEKEASGRWHEQPVFSPSAKSPARYGPFKEAFQNRMQFVYGTLGNREEREDILTKLRYDSEVFWYRGNGAPEIIADVDFDSKQDVDRNIILYGNAETNSAWPTLMAGSPIEVHRERIRIDSRHYSGNDLATLFVRPRPGSERALVAAVAWSGHIGARTLMKFPIFASGISFPDWIVIGPDIFTKGSRGVKGAGFFGPDWNFGSGDFAWEVGDSSQRRWLSHE